ncbi:hypothetical protein BDZ90DRAFT_234273, partial [Jaminaea rosea]
MSPPLSLSQSSFLLSSLLSTPPHRQDQRPLLSARPFLLSPPSDDEDQEGESRISIGQTSVSVRLTTSVLRSADYAEDTAEESESSAADMAGGGSAGSVWSVDVRTSPGCEVPVLNGGNSSKTGCLELDASLETLQHLVHSHLTAAFGRPERLGQFIILPPSHPSSARPLRGATHWALGVDVLVHSMAGGNVYDAAWAALCAALWRVRLPRTKEIAYARAPGKGAGDGDATMEEVGIASLKGKASASRAVDFELVDGSGRGVPLEGREDVGTGITLGMLPNGSHLLDPTLEEALCLPSSRQLFLVASHAPPRILITHLLPSLLNLTAGEASNSGGDNGDAALRLPMPPTGAREGITWETGGWGSPSWSRVREAIQVGAQMATQLGGALRGELEKEEREAEGRR